MNFLPARYETLLIDYKVVIRKTKARILVLPGVIFFMMVFSYVSIAYQNNWQLTSIWIALIPFQVGTIGFITYRMLKNTFIIEIDAQNKTIVERKGVRYQYEDVLTLNISKMTGSNGYVYDYLQLALKSGDPVKLMQLHSLPFFKDKEGEKLAQFIAEATGLTLLKQPQK